MTTSEVIDGIRRLLGKHKGSERQLLEALLEEAECWGDRLTELDAEDAD